MSAAISPPARALTRRGLRFEKLLAGATMFAAMLVVRVATRMAASASGPSTGLPRSAASRPTSSTGFQMAVP